MAYAPVPMPRNARPGGYPISNSADSNPFAQFFGSSKGANALIGLGTGLLSGPTFAQGLAAGGQGYMQGAQQDDAYAKMKAEEAERQKKITDAAALKDKYSKYLIDNGRQDLVQPLMDGLITEAQAWEEVVKPKDPVNMEFRDVNGDIIGLNPVTGDSRMVYDGPASTPSLPTSYQEFQLAQENPDYAASLSSSTSKPPTEGERRNQQLSSVIEPELKVVEDNWDALTNAADQANASFGRAATSPAYQAAADSLKTIAQSYLYSISGQAATDSETEKIVSSLTPVFGESKASADNKKARVRRMVEAVKAAGGRAAPAGGPADPLGIR